MRDFWNRLGGADAISWVTFLVVVVLQFAGSFLASGVNFSGREGEFAILSLATLVPVIVILTIARAVLRATTMVTARPLVTLSFLALAIFTRAVLFGNGLVVLGFTDEARVGYRMLSSTFSVGFGVVITAYLFSLSRDMTRDSRLLSSALEQLTLLGETAQDRIATKQAGLLQKIRTELEIRLRVISGNAPREDRAKLQLIIDDVVRPLSYDLARQVEEFKAERNGFEPTQIGWKSVITYAMAVDQTRPLLFSLLVGLETLHFLPVVFGPRGIFAALALMVTSFFVLSLVRRTWGLLPAFVSTGWRMVIFTVFYGAGAVSGAVAVWLTTGINALFASELILIAIFLITLGWTFVLTSSANAQRRAGVVELTEANLSLKRELVRLNANYRQLQKGVARVLHGPIQDAVAAAVHKMSSETLNQDASLTLVRELRERIRRALEGLSSPVVVRHDVDMALADLAELWDGVVGIELQLDRAVTARFVDFPVTASTVIELVREVCSNAVRHGDASRIWVELLPGADASVLEINVSNDGRPLQEGAGRGIGSQLLEELSLSWSRFQDGELVRVRASVPVF